MSISQSVKEHPSKEQIFAAILMAGLALMPILAVFVPRFMAYGPGAIAILAAIGWLLVFRVRPTLSRPVFLWAIAIIVLAGFSSFWSLDQDFALQRTGKMALILIPGALLFSVCASVRLEYIRPVLWFLPLCLGIAALLNISELLFDMLLYRLLHGLDPSDIAQQSALNRGIFCTLAGFFVSMFIILKWDTKALYRRLSLAALSVLMLFVLLLTASQSNQLGFGIGLLMFFAFPYRSKIAWIILAVFLAGLLLATPWLAQMVFKTFATNIEGLSWLQRGYAANRMEIWDFVSRHALQNPLYGHGIEATRHVEAFDTAKIYHPSDNVLHPHNFAVQLWIEFGVMGALLAAGLFAHLLYGMRAASHSAAKIALPTLFIFISVASTGYGLWQGWWLGESVLMLSLCMMTMRAYKQ